MKRSRFLKEISAGVRDLPPVTLTILVVLSAAAGLAMVRVLRKRSTFRLTPEARESYYREEVGRVAKAVLDGPGETSNTLRRAVEARSARLAGGAREEAPIPSELEGYVQKVALYAYKVTDEDVEELKARGYSEDEIFEITVAASLGAGLARMEEGFGVLKGGT